ncbi:fatty acid oxygenase [Tricladium varicosporioides]|nr:fatty acid oxygenase [Hymenoscyphus varicosporioides]
MPSSHPAPTAHSVISGLGKDLETQLTRIPEDLTAINSLVEAAFSGGLVDDRKLLLEEIIQAVASLPSGSAGAAKITNRLLGNLWDNLKHPPLSYMGNTFRYRTADGSYNNILYPDLGKSGSFYARSVVPQKSLQAPLPDPGTIFDALFARKGPAREHPAKFSSLAIAIATLIIHDVFRTDDADWNRVASSSYLDLGPLYGHNQAQQDTVRTFKDGLLKPDAFAEPRIVGQPPGVGALLICFNRFHNYVVGQLAEINENKRFSLPTGKESDPAATAQRDNDLFQTGRLVTCGLYVNIILKDYVRVILNLNSTFDPFDTQGIPKGIGNQVSIEFNLIYRWHGTISDKNAKWTEDFFKAIFPGIDPQAMTQQQLLDGVKAWGHHLDADPGKWEVGGLKRNAGGGFDDADLVRLLTEETEDVAGAFGARNVPAILKAVDVLGIEQGRAWGAASLNEVRKFFKLKPYETFLDINSDPDVAASLEALYTHPDNVELYPGLSAEEAKPPIAPGSGLCSGYTITKAILSDAVALVRGDRFYSVDSSPANLTSFGYNEIASDPSVLGGVVIRKLLMRAFPGWYRGNSVYALFPLTVPEENKKIFQGFGTDKDYSFDRPSFIPPPIPIKTWQANADILSDRVNYKVPWGPHIYDLIGREYMLGSDNEASIKQHKAAIKALYSPTRGLEEFRNYYERIMNDLIRQNICKLRDYYELDAIRDATNLSHANFIANLFHIPLKTKASEEGITAQQLFDMLRTIFAWVSLDLDPTKSFALRAKAKKCALDLGKIYRGVVEAVKGERFHVLKELMGIGVGVMPDYGTDLIRRFFAEGMDVDDVVWTVIPLAAEASFQGQGSAQMIDLYLSEKYKIHWPAIQMVARDSSPEAFNQLRKYALEAYRLTSPALTLREVGTNSATINDSDNKLNLKKGDPLLMNFITAGVDPEKIPDPYEIKLDRPEDSYIVFGHGSHSCVGREIVVTAMAAQLRVFGKLKNLRRAPGQAGMLKMKYAGGAFKVYMNEDWSDWTPYPASLKVNFDDF